MRFTWPSRSHGTAAALFSATYDQAQERFLEAAARAGARVESLLFQPTDAASGPLPIDLAWIGSDQPTKLLVHLSGLHGVEAFAGSPIQLAAIAQPLSLDSKTAVVFVHVLNPWGARHARRVNHANVDLNRNCLLPPYDYRGASDGYRLLERLLNPPTPPSRDLFLARGAWALMRHRMAPLRQAVVGGQYEFPKGLFFGGHELQPEPRVFLQWMSERLPKVRYLIGIDVHTGLGRPGTDVLLADPTEAKEVNERRRRGFGDRLNPHLSQRVVGYEARGALGPAVAATLPAAQVDWIVQEFGTYGPFQVIHALREENRCHWHGDGTVDHPAKARLREVFCPASVRWRESLVRLGLWRFGQALELLRTIPISELASGERP